MSFAIDVNILLYASSEDDERHPAARSFLERCALGGELFYLTWPTVMGYLRMVTHPRIFTSPFSQDEACEHIEALTSLPHCRVIGELAGFWGVYRALTTEVPARGNLVPDAHLAAILRQHGVVRLYTCDRDFRKFDFLQAVDPLRT